MSDLEVLVSEMENALRVGDIGDDLASTKQLSKKHQVDIRFFFQVGVYIFSSQHQFLSKLPC